MPKDVPNEDQKKIIKSSVDSFFHELLKNSPPNEFIKLALESLCKPILNAEEVKSFEQKGIWEPIKLIRTILSHPCPQNYTSDTLPEDLEIFRNILDNYESCSAIFCRVTNKEIPTNELSEDELKIRDLYTYNYEVSKYINFYIQHRTENNLIIAADFLGKLAVVQQKGLLNLIVLDNPTREPITKQDLIKYVFKLIGERYQQFFGQELIPNLYASYGAITTEVFDDSLSILSNWVGSRHFLREIDEKEEELCVQYSNKISKINEIAFLQIVSEDKLCFHIDINPAFYEELFNELFSYISHNDPYPCSLKTILFIRAISSEELPKFLDKLTQIEPSVSLLKVGRTDHSCSYPWEASVDSTRWGKGAIEYKYRNLQFIIDKLKFRFGREGGVQLDLSFNSSYQKTLGACLKKIGYPLPRFYSTSPGGHYNIELPNLNLLNGFLNVLYSLGLFGSEMLEELKVTAKLYLKELPSPDGWLKNGDFRKNFYTHSDLNRQVIYTNLSRNRKIKKITMQGYQNGGETLTLHIDPEKINGFVLFLKKIGIDIKNYEKDAGYSTVKIPSGDYLHGFLNLLQQEDSSITKEVIGDIVQSYRETVEDRTAEFSYERFKQQGSFCRPVERPQSLTFFPAVAAILPQKTIDPNFSEIRRSNANNMSVDVTDEEMAEYYSNLEQTGYSLCK